MYNLFFFAPSYLARPWSALRFASIEREANQCLLSGEERKSLPTFKMTAFDPHQT
jgi:hypothetical protein